MLSKNKRAEIIGLLLFHFHDTKEERAALFHCVMAADVA